MNRKNMMVGFIGLLGLLITLGTTIAFGNVPPTPPPPPEGQSATPIPPKGPTVPMQNDTIQNPPSLPIPPPISKEEVVKELNHAYSEIQITYNLTNTARFNGVQINVQKLIDLSTSLYNEAMKYYNSENYEFARAYVHLSIESSHMAQEILRHTLEQSGIETGPPIPPP